MVNCGGVRPDGWMRGIVALTAVVAKLVAHDDDRQRQRGDPQFHVQIHSLGGHQPGLRDEHQQPGAEYHAVQVHQGIQRRQIGEESQVVSA